MVRSEEEIGALRASELIVIVVVVVLICVVAVGVLTTLN